MAGTISYTRQDRGALFWPADTYPLAVVVEEGLELDNVGVPDNAHDLEFTVLSGWLAVDAHVRGRGGGRRAEGRRGGEAQNTHTLKRLSWRTRLMAASSPLGDSLVWKTTPKEPLPTILHCV